MSMDTEEVVLAQPCEAVILIGGKTSNVSLTVALASNGTDEFVGCHKTTVTQLMGSISARLRIAEETGKNAVLECNQRERLRLQTVLTRESCRRHADWRAGCLLIDGIAPVADHVPDIVANTSMSQSSRLGLPVPFDFTHLPTSKPKSQVEVSRRPPGLGNSLVCAECRTGV